MPSVWWATENISPATQHSSSGKIMLLHITTQRTAENAEPSQTLWGLQLLIFLQTRSHKSERSNGWVTRRPAPAHQLLELKLNDWHILLVVKYVGQPVRKIRKPLLVLWALFGKNEETGNWVCMSGRVWSAAHCFQFLSAGCTLPQRGTSICYCAIS